MKQRAFAFLFLAASGCSGELNQTFEPVNDAGADGLLDATVADVGTDVPPNDCPVGFGPTMVRLPNGYCIDQTEVTRAQYQAWLATQPVPSGICHWKPSLAPDPACLAESSVCQGSNCGDHPQVCLSWCSAADYCTASGKQLCSAVPDALTNDPLVDLWMNACTSGGTTTYPWGNDFDPSRCNTEDGTTRKVASSPACQSSTPGYEGIYDLIGNVEEFMWLRELDDTGRDPVARGGPYFKSKFSKDPWSCKFEGLNRHLFYPWVGFRCCSNIIPDF